MNKVILSVFLLAGVVCLVDAACNVTVLVGCGTTLSSDMRAAGGNATKKCAAVAKLSTCLTGTQCLSTSCVKTVTDATALDHKVSCATPTPTPTPTSTSTSVVINSIAVMLLALAASHCGSE